MLGIGLRDILSIEIHEEKYLMIIKSPIKIIAFLLLSTVLFAQQENLITSEIKFEVDSESLQITEKPQTISVKIACESAEVVQFYNLRFAETDAVWSLISARLNGDSLWLIQSNSAPSQNKVLSWETEKSKSHLILFPASWQSGYVLELEIQINLEHTSNIVNDTDEKILLGANLPSGSYESSPFGRGNRISFK
jgi:hypothetical protein